MTTAFYRLATRADAVQLGHTMCEADERECRAFRCSPLEALLAAFEHGTPYAIVEPDGHVYAMFGITREAPGHGHPWMLTSDSFHKISFAFARRHRQFFDELSKDYAYLSNLVGADHHIAHRWLEWLGFTIGDTPIEIANSYFYHFWKQIPPCASPS